MKTRIITAVVGIIVLIGVLFTFDTLIFNLVIAAITLIAIHEIFKALGFGKRSGRCTAFLCPIPCLSCCRPSRCGGGWSCRPLF